MNKTLIKTRFARSMKTYDKNAVVQKEMAQKLLDLSPKSDFESILEIGCGTGFLTKLALKKFHFRNYTANDIVADCEEYISPLSENINFINADIETLIQKSEKTFDLIISNAALQWVDDIESCIIKLMNMLTQNGILLFSTFGRENFKEIFQLTGKTLNYKSAAEYDKLFSNYRHEIREDIRSLTFKTPEEALHHLKLTGVNSLETGIWTKKNLSEFCEKYLRLSNGKLSLTYHPLYIFVEKKHKK